MRFKGSTIFVTGGAGFIGSAVIRHLLSDTEAFVVNIDKLTYAANLDFAARMPRPTALCFEQVDICDGRRNAPLFEKYRPTP